MKSRTEYLETDGVFLDPATCGSSVRYSITVKKKSRRSFCAEVALTDCDKTIMWSGWGDEGCVLMASKLDRAIRILIKARSKLDAAGAAYKKLAPRKRKNASR